MVTSNISTVPTPVSIRVMFPLKAFTASLKVISKLEVIETLVSSSDGLNPETKGFVPSNVIL